MKRIDCRVWRNATGSALLLMTMAVFAADAQEPARPPAIATECQLVLGQAAVDYGRFTAGELATIAGTHGDQRLFTAGKKSVPVTVSCPSPAALALTIRGPLAPDGSWRFSDHGVIRLTLSDARLDNSPASFVDEFEPQRLQPSVVLRPGRRVRVKSMEGAAEGMTLGATLTIEPLIPYQDTRVADQQVWRTEVKLELLTKVKP